MRTIKLYAQARLRELTKPENYGGEIISGAIEGIEDDNIKNVYTYLRTRTGRIPTFSATVYKNGAIVVWHKYGASYFWPKSESKRAFDYCKARKPYLIRTMLYT